MTQSSPRVRRLRSVATRCWRVLAFGAVSCGAACAESAYTFFQDGIGSGGSGGEVTSGVGGSGGLSGGGGLASTGGRAPHPGSAGSGAGGAGPCQSTDNPSLTTVRLELAGTGLCFGRGVSSVLVTDPIYFISLLRCDSSPEQLWTVRALDAEAVEVRNESSGFNLDVQFAAPDDGTPFVLFEPHELYNQRFHQRSVEGGFALAPLHAPSKCLTERDGKLGLWACDPTGAHQAIRTLECEE